MGQHRKRIALRESYSREHNRCALCHIPEPCHGRFRTSLDMAHIISRSVSAPNSDCSENVVMLCSSCHGAQHNHGYCYAGVKWPNITLFHLLRAKKDLHELDPVVLGRLWGRAPKYVAEMARTDLPDEILAEREMWERPLTQIMKKYAEAKSDVGGG